MKIDKEFQSLIPPLGAEELHQLEENIKRDGCRDPLVKWEDILLDGHNRKAICDRLKMPYKEKAVKLDDRDAAKIWIIQNQFGRRNLAPYTRGELALKLEPLFAKKAKQNQRDSGGPVPQKSAKPPIDTRKEIAKVAGLSHDTIAKTKLINEYADEETKTKLRENKVSINRVAKDIKDANQKASRHEKRQQSVKTAPESDKRIIVGDFRELADIITDDSLSLIFTDPPYNKKSRDLFDGLGSFAADKLSVGGSLICYVGQTQIPEAIEALRCHLRYWWVICCIHSGGANLMNEYGIRCGWKAVLWFVKGTRDDKENIVSDTMSGGREKQSHDWQQSQTEAEYWIESLCPPNGIVCDPFLGGGTTGAAANVLGRKWIGFEIDKTQASIAAERCNGKG